MNPGWIYILTNKSMKSDYLKIGRTANDPHTRASEISSATGVATPFSVAYSVTVPDCIQAENLIHKKLMDYRVNNNREFFQVNIQTAQGVVNEICKNVRLKSPLCCQCKANKATVELAKIKKEFQKNKSKLKQLKQQISIFSFIRSYILIIILAIRNTYQKLIPDLILRRVYFWGLLVPLCIVGWAILLYKFDHLPEALVLTTMLISAIIVIGSVQQEE